MTEQDLLLETLKQQYDMVWEYRRDRRQMTVHRNGIAPELAGGTFTVPELKEQLSRRHDLIVAEPTEHRCLNERFLHGRLDAADDRIDQQTYFRLRDAGLKWYSIRFERIGPDRLLLLGRDLYRSVNDKAIRLSMQGTVDNVIAIDCTDGRYTVSYARGMDRMPTAAYNYADMLRRFVDGVVDPAQREQARQDLALDRVCRELQAQDTYRIFLTAQEGGQCAYNAYKQFIFSFLDDEQSRIVMTRLDITETVRHYEERQETRLDVLTGAHSRNYYEQELKDVRFTGGVAVIDLDDLKLCNDVFGHGVGDIALMRMSRAILGQLGARDVLIRYGGDEFLLLMPGVTEQRFIDTLQAIRMQMHKISMTGYDDLRLTASIGGITVKDECPADAVPRADRLMYRAKQHKDTVVTGIGHDEQPSAADDPADSDVPMILIVDDSALNRQILSEMLGDGYRVLEAADGKEGLRSLERYGTGIALVLLDLFMPVMDGYAVLQEMERRRIIRDIPVIMISADTAAEQIRRAYDLGVTDYISRPFDAQIVHRRVMNTIKMYAKQRRLAAIVRRQIGEQERENEVIVDILCRVVGYREPESEDHLRNVKKGTALLLEQLLTDETPEGLTWRDCSLIAAVSVLHDIGKLGVDDRILNKPGPLTSGEYEQVKLHTVYGEMMLRDMDRYSDEPLLRMAAQICRWHHERIDGSGYPDGLKGSAIPIAAQVVGLMDAYDALVSDRVYKKAYPHDAAVKMITDGECGAFDPRLLRCLAKIGDRLRDEVYAVERQKGEM